MKITTYRFRTAEEWKSALMNLQSFFELMRSVFGNIKTPYNKQKLMDDLVIFLSRDDIRKIISSYLDEEDRRIIAATAFLEDPSPEELENFLQGEKNIMSVRGALMNMEERLILFRFADEDSCSRRLALNPVLETILGPIAAETGILFPFRNHKTENAAESAGKAAANASAGAGALCADSRIFGMFIAFLSAEEDFFKADGIRKKIIDQGKKLFPQIDLETAAGTLKCLELFYSEGEKFLPDMRRIQRFAELHPAERREYWAAGLYLHANENNSVLSRNQVVGITRLIHRFCCYLEPAKIYPDVTFRRLLVYLETENNRDLWNPAEKIKPAVLIRALEEAGILRKHDEQMWKYQPLNLNETEGPVIAMDSTFTFILYPGISMEDILKLAAFSQIRENSPFSFELTRDSAVRGFDTGLDSHNMIKILAELSGNSMDESLEWTLKDWESRYMAVSLREGLILGLAQERQYLAESEPVTSLIQKKLAPGLYLLSGTRAAAAAALEKAGVDIIAEPKQQDSDAEPFSKHYGYFPSHGHLMNEISIFKKNYPAGENSCVETKKHFSDYLKKLQISRPEKEELLSRIERRIILSESQLERAAFKYQKLEARFMDYQGKNAIVKQALADGSVLEVTLPDQDGGSSVTTGYPSALEKKGGESVLVLRPINGSGEAENSGEEENPIRIPLGKISLLRMIKKSIFNN